MSVEGWKDRFMGERVLICENEGMTVMQLRRALTRAGIHIVGEVSSGEGCVHITLRERPDIVLMDIGLNGLDGVDATRQIMTDQPRVW